MTNDDKIQAPDTALVAQIKRLLDADVFEESLEGYAAAAAAASMLNDWESSDDGTGFLTTAVKRSDVDDVIRLLQAWKDTLTDTPAEGQTT